MKHNHIRPQAVYSRLLAVEGLISLMREGSYDAITISSICKTGGICRQTFYRNFDGKDDVIVFYANYVVSRYVDKVEGNMESDLTLFCKNIPFSKEFLLLLKKNHLMHLLRDSIVAVIEAYMRSHVFHVLLGDHKNDTYLKAFIADTIISLLGSWVDRNFAESEDELYDMTLVFLQGLHD